MIGAGSRALTSISLLGKQGNNALIGDTVGNVLLVDTRSGKLVRKLHGTAGSVVAAVGHKAVPVGVVTIAIYFIFNSKYLALRGGYVLVAVLGCYDHACAQRATTYLRSHIGIVFECDVGTDCR